MLSVRLEKAIADILDIVPITSRGGAQVHRGLPSDDLTPPFIHIEAFLGNESPTLSGRFNVLARVEVHSAHSANDSTTVTVHNARVDRVFDELQSASMAARLTATDAGIHVYSLSKFKTLRIRYSEDRVISTIEFEASCAVTPVVTSAVVTAAPSSGTLTSGAVLFGNGTTGANTDPANLFWDDTNNRLGIVNASPQVTLDVGGIVACGIGGLVSFRGGADLRFYVAHDVTANHVVLNGTGVTTRAFQIRDSLAADAVRFSVNFLTGATGIGVTPTAMLHIKAGSATANTAPLKFTSGPLLTAAEPGAAEFLTDKIYFTITTGAARKEFTLNDATLTSSRVPFATTNGRLTDNANLLWDNANSRLGLGKSPSVRLDMLSENGTSTALRVGWTLATANALPLFGKGSLALFVGAGTTNEGPNLGLLQVNIGVAGVSQSASEVYIAATRGASATERVAVANGDILGQIGFFGDDGTDVRGRGNIIQSVVDTSVEAVATGIIPARLAIVTAEKTPITFHTDAGAMRGGINPITAGERMRITHLGNVGIGTVSPNGRLQLTGDTSGTVTLLCLRQNNDQAYGFDARMEQVSVGRLELCVVNAGTQTPFMYVLRNAGRIGLGEIAPTAVLHLKAGTTAASTAPLKFTSGSLMTVAEAGAVEFLTDKAYLTITTGAARKEFTLNDAALGTGRIPYTTTNGRLTSHENMAFDGTNVTFGAGLTVVGNLTALTFTTSGGAAIINNEGVGFFTAAEIAGEGVITFGSAGTLGDAGGNLNFTGNFVTNTLAIAEGSIISGTYTPTLTNVTNLDSSTAYACQYSRVGNVVTVSGKVDVDPTTTNTATALGISLPIASSFATQQQCGGVGAQGTVSGSPMAIRADATNDRAEMFFVASTTTSLTVYFTFTYLIV